MFERIKEWWRKRTRPPATTTLERRIRQYRSEEWIRWIIQENPAVKEALADPQLRLVEIRKDNGVMRAVAQFSAEPIDYFSDPAFVEEKVIRVFDRDFDEGTAWNWVFNVFPHWYDKYPYQ